ncbi:putative reverse transcriptase domain-containing protein [Tanacetum coccineum]
MVDHYQKWHNGTSTRTRSCESCGGPHYTKDCPLREEGKTLEEVYYTQFVVPFPQGERYRAAAPGFYQRDSGNPSYQERRKTMEELLSKIIAESAKRHDENSNLINKVLQERRSESIPSSTKRNPRDHVKSITTTVEFEMPSICRIKPVRYAVSSHQKIMKIFKPSQSIIYFPNRLIDDSYEEKEVLSRMMDSEKSVTYLKRVFMERPRMGYQSEASMNVHDSAILKESLPLKEKDPESFTIPCYINNTCFEKALADLGASVSVMPYTTFTNLGLGELAPTKLIIELVDRTIKPPKGIAENVFVGIDKFVNPIDFIVLDMPEDIKVPLILGRPFLSTAHRLKIEIF